MFDSCAISSIVIGGDFISGIKVNGPNSPIPLKHFDLSYLVHEVASQLITIYFNRNCVVHFSANNLTWCYFVYCCFPEILVHFFLLYFKTFLYILYKVVFCDKPGGRIMLIN